MGAESTKTPRIMELIVNDSKFSQNSQLWVEGRREERGRGGERRGVRAPDSKGSVLQIDFWIFYKQTMSHSAL